MYVLRTSVPTVKRSSMYVYISTLIEETKFHIRLIVPGRVMIRKLKDEASPSHVREAKSCETNYYEDDVWDRSTKPLMQSHDIKTKVVQCFPPQTFFRAGIK